MSTELNGNLLAVFRVDVAIDRRLSFGQRVIYMVTLAQGAWLGWVQLDTGKIARLLGIDPETVRRAIRRLAALGYLLRRRGPGRGQSVRAIHPGMTSCADA